MLKITERNVNELQYQLYRILLCAYFLAIFTQPPFMQFSILLLKFKIQMKSWYLFIIPCLFLMSCSGKRQKLNRIDKLKKDVYQKNDEGESKNVDTQKVMQLVKAYDQFAKQYPQDTLAPVFLYEAGRLHEFELHDYKGAVIYYDQVQKKYPDHRLAPYALFRESFIYENELHDLKKARKGYQNFLKRYPHHQFADDAKFSLSTMGRNMEQVLQELIKKNKALSDSLTKDTVAP